MKDYLELCKPRVVLLMLLTAIVGMCLASPSWVPLKALIFGTLGIGLVSSAGGILNHLADQRIDTIMARTQKRPLPSGKISPKRAALFALILGSLGLGILVLWVNIMTAVLSFFSLIGYAGVYTLYLKRATPQNIVIGGIFGAAPPLLGWTAVTGTLDPYALLLVLIIFVWTPPHFWALAIYRKEEYAKAGIPMLPVTHGIPFTKLCIVLYTILLLIVSLLPFLTGMSGLIYLVGALGLGFEFLYYAILLKRSDNPAIAYKTFRYSITYLMLLFAGLLIDHYYRYTL